MPALHLTMGDTSP